MIAQTTLAGSSAPVTGQRLDQEGTATVRFHPAPVGTGITFVRRDLPGGPGVACRVEHIGLQVRWSSLEQDGVVVHFTEHILAALAGCDVDNVLIEVDGDRIPVVTGGSGLGFVEAIQAAGLTSLPEPRMVYRLKRAVHMETDLDVPAGAATPVRAARRYVHGLPAGDFSADYVFHVPAVPGLRVGLARYDHAHDEFRTGIGRARTYYLQVETTEVSGLLSAARRDYIVLHARSPQADVDEVARHKLMDLWGDLRLLGRPVWGRFVAFRTGHRFHHDLIRKLAGEDYLELVELVDVREVV